MNRSPLFVLVLSLGCYGATQTECGKPSSPSPSPSPTIKPSPGPSASPAPSVAGVAACALPPTNPALSFCQADGPSVLEPAVALAQAWVEANTGLVNRTTGKVAEEAGYTSALAQRLRETDSGAQFGVPGVGWCAQSFSVPSGGPTDEVWLKSNQSMSHHFDVVQADGSVWLKTSVRCAPSRF